MGRYAFIGRSGGNLILNVVPRPGTLEALTFPPCRSTIALTIERPRPLPDWAVLAGSTL
jgi:hypothetical protein